ncbi:putative membrane protein [Collimonas sp. PA-H2]|uniref:anthrone oxygenase family protein n=1 Tax=Collimonas sp. PA-H2 TaxID=1881062 RepID=UPI000BFA7ED2|nr:anthrone oxygenase family protein [Collimonas sp. PA-H2]PFH11017.1 putative membrane protein [Collimonas sp. PA-H2]
MSFIENLLFPISLYAAVACGLLGGLFFAFSNFVMNALSRIHPSNGIAAMQSINITVLNPLFLALFLGTALVCAVLLVFAAFRWQHAHAGWLLAGSLVYLAGGLLVTMACNVPLNDALAKLDPAKPESTQIWRSYISVWANWNHVRTISCLASAALFTIAIWRQT